MIIQFYWHPSQCNFIDTGNRACHLMAIVWATILVPYHPYQVTANHLKIRCPQISPLSAQNQLDYMTGYKDSHLNNGCTTTCPIDVRYADGLGVGVDGRYLASGGRTLGERAMYSGQHAHIITLFHSYQPWTDHHKTYNNSLRSSPLPANYQTHYKMRILWLNS